MDSKEKFLVDELCRRITEQKFHERDVLALLILLRGHSAVESPVRELADFIAHREKDRGALKKYVQHVVAYGQALANGTAAQLKIDPVFTAAAFRDSLNSVLAGLSIRVFPKERTDDVLACTMSLLQDVRLIHEKREIGRLGGQIVGRQVHPGLCHRVERDGHFHPLVERCPIPWIQSQHRGDQVVREHVVK